VKLATERLELRPVAAPDLPAVHALWTTAHVRRFLFDDRELSLDASAALVRHAAERLGIRRIDADVDEPNQASVRVVERLGMKPLGRTLVAGKPLLNFTWSA
jgi:RimJ/RimL family protein N-acetyltransferase